MSDVFLSYSREDRDKATSLARALENAGLTTFVDRRIVAGASWDDVIEKELRAASAVVVLWSERSTKSDWVKVEADAARREHKLVPARLDTVRLPLGFSQIETADLSDWDGSREHTGLQSLIEATIRHVRPVRRSESHGLVPGDATPEDPGRRYRELTGATRTNVFIAHASADKPKLKPVLVPLIDQGFRLWVDKPHLIGLGALHESRLASNRIQYGEDWRESIRVAVGKADAVLAFWSLDAVNGRREQFHYEVYMAMMQKKLNQCRIDSVPFSDIGMPYTFDQIADLSQVSPHAYSAELDYLMSDLVNRRRAWWRFSLVP